MTSEAVEESTPTTEPAPHLHVVLVEPEIAGNTGAVGRTCVALGARLWLVRPLGFHLDERHRRRAGLDYWDELDLRVVDSLDQACADHPWDRLWFFTKRAPRSYTDARYEPGAVLIFGSESRGLPRGRIEAAGDQAVRIPISARARSLNLSCAVAVAGFEAVRQMESPGPC